MGLMDYDGTFILFGTKEQLIKVFRELELDYKHRCDSEKHYYEKFKSMSQEELELKIHYNCLDVDFIKYCPDIISNFSYDCVDDIRDELLTEGPHINWLRWLASEVEKYEISWEFYDSNVNNRVTINCDGENIHIDTYIWENEEECEFALQCAEENIKPEDIDWEKFINEKVDKQSALFSVKTN